jgi:hypothetical protein
LIVLAVLLLVVPMTVGLYTDWLWFQEVGYQIIFTKSLTTRLLLGALVGVVVFALVYANLRLTIHFSRDYERVVRLSPDGSVELDIKREASRIALPVSLIAGIVAGLYGASRWETMLLYLNRTEFGVSDPIFGRDVSFYFFTLPVLEFVGRLASTVLTLSLIATSVFYLLRGAMTVDRQHVWVDRAAKVHLCVLAALVFLSLAFGTYLDMPNLLYSQRGPMTGASYTDVEAVLLALKVLLAVTLLGALLFIGNIFRQGNGLAALAGSLYLLVLVLGVWLYPAGVQKLTVGPNELVKETDYIAHNIAATRRAFALDQVEERELTGEMSLTSKDIQDNGATIKNIRLWDHGPLLDTFSQIQEIRTYYDFASVDNDRYLIDGESRQIMLSARELNSESLPNRNWINERLTFTHGYGLTLGPVNQVTTEGLPVLFVKDIPPASSIDSVRIERPEIYFGELSSDYAIVKTTTEEFNYPSGEANVYSEYGGEGGVELGAFRRFLYSIRFRKADILLSGAITSDSRILYYRNIGQRVRRIAPFLRFDRDPYLVIHDGDLYWIYDAYTVSNRYPYAEPTEGGVNYIRNSVKVVIDAYHGKTLFYIADPSDPLIQTYSKIFPEVFLPMSEMPDGLRQHLRYPEDLFRIQTAIYSTYHMDKPQAFYNKEDQWEAAAIQTGDKAELMEPYYTIMKLPGERDDEFILMLPFTPKSKDNLSAWMVARSDGEHYGKLRVYRFPKQRLVYGPKQITARINQDAEISRQITLWDQRGSQVIQGTLLVIPIKESLIYVRPLYIRAESGRIPELKRVIVAYENRIAMEETLDASLARIFGGAPPKPSGAEPPTVAGQPTPGQPQPATSENLAAQAKQHYDRATQALRDGNWALYGEEIKRLGEVLERMQSKSAR